MMHLDNSAFNTASISDTADNTFTLAASSRLQEVGDGVQTVEIWFAAGINSSPNDVITATLSGSTTATMIAHEYRGLATGQPFEAANTGYLPTTTSVPSGDFAATAGSLVVAFGVPENTGTIVAGTGTWTAGAGFTLTDHEPTRDMQAEELIGAPGGEQTASLTYSVAGNMIISAASFHP
jgi:hypothetical protein